MSKEVCNHLEGMWKRMGQLTVIECKNKDYRVTFDVDSPSAFQLFENEAWVEFGKPSGEPDGCDHNYLKPASIFTDTYKCGKCGKEFQPRENV